MSYTNGLDDPTLYFSSTIWTGNGVDDRNIVIDGTGMQPDFVWIKSRNDTDNHRLVDSVRGATKHLESDGTGAEQTSSNVKAFTSTGVTLSTNGSVNANSELYASWSWKAGTSFSNSSGSNGANLDSTGSVSTTAGFSIVSFTGNRSTTRNIYHGLGAVPKMIIFKNRNTTNGWTIYNAVIGNANKLTLNSTNASGACTACFASTNPTSTLFSVGDDSDTNGTSNNMIAYCFAEKKGYSKFGSYTGNGNADGTFVYTGFKPAFVIQKASSASSYDWVILDNKRDPFNVADESLYANLSSAVQTSNHTDFLSNGFKLRSTAAGNNGSGTSYIFMAFAEESFVTSTGVPATAR